MWARDCLTDFKGQAKGHNMGEVSGGAQRWPKMAEEILVYRWIGKSTFIMLVVQENSAEQKYLRFRKQSKIARTWNKI